MQWREKYSLLSISRRENFHCHLYILVHPIGNYIKSLVYSPSEVHAINKIVLNYASSACTLLAALHFPMETTRQVHVYDLLFSMFLKVGRVIGDGDVGCRDARCGTPGRNIGDVNKTYHRYYKLKISLKKKSSTYTVFA